MLGFYNYTVILTYISLCSAVTGIFTAIAGNGHPFVGTCCLLISGLCDSFDGIVARKKKDRTEAEKKFGIQIDSLVDLIAFGVLPCAIGYACYMSHSGKGIILSQKWTALKIFADNKLTIYFVIFCIYILAGLIRLAYFNVMEEERQSKTSEKRRYYEGLPITASCMIFPTIMLIQYIVGDSFDISPYYVIALLITSYLFVSKVHIKKPGFREIMIMVGIGAIEFALMIIFKFFV